MKKFSSSHHVRTEEKKGGTQRQLTDVLMSGTCLRATGMHNDFTAFTVIQASWKPDIHSLYSANILHNHPHHIQQSKAQKQF